MAVGGPGLWLRGYTTKQIITNGLSTIPHCLPLSTTRLSLLPNPHPEDELVKAIAEQGVYASSGPSRASEAEHEKRSIMKEAFEEARNGLKYTGQTPTTIDEQWHFRTKDDR